MKDKVIKIFSDEFGALAHKFRVEPFQIIEAREATYEPGAGVYIFIKDEEVIKVGRSLDNPRKRALEHIRDNSTSKDGSIQMKTFEGDHGVELLLITLLDSEKDLHWTCALEVFLERTLKPKIGVDRIA